MQHLDAASNFLVPTDHRVQFALLGTLGQIDGVFFQCLPVFLGIGIDDLFTAAHVIDGFFQSLPVCAGLFQYFSECSFQVESGQHKNFAGDVLIPPLLCQLVAQVQHLDQFIGKADFTFRAANARQAVQAFAQLGSQRVHPHTSLGQKVTRSAAFLVKQGHHHVYRFDQLVVQARCQALGIG